MQSRTVGMGVRKASVIPSAKQSSGYERKKASLIPRAKQNSGYGSEKSKFDTQPKAEQWV